MARRRPASRPDAFQAVFSAVADNIARALVGKEDAIELSLVCLAAEGHLLIEDVPGVGKTTLAKALAASFASEWNRIQFTPDLLPSDVTGVTVFSRTGNRFEFRPGGVFANIVLADEINRASPKTQAALLEAMEERQVTVDATTYALPDPFMVIATQNPVEHEGTYPLPDSQLDRFLMRIPMGYPAKRAEIAMLDEHALDSPVHHLSAVATVDDVHTLIAGAQGVHVATQLRAYIVDLADATRRHPSLALGASPRAALALQKTARARAAASGRDFATADDVKAIAGPVLGHRLVPTPEADFEGVDAEAILDDLLARLPVPSSGALRA
ncbi:MAG TPA: MoxR family ATPase [Acidimicrobiales bacterium]|nr:MoxR family ATPase [Acidimicrobiales bacterium]